ncbi:MAG TPA: site-specific DNA-methyltransferase [Candidatus Ozemobacteraceae bacterium]|nr:site-specific DNA-methyltransferase [Candidatus Ozemobacteraceae bacterium]
MNADCCRGLFLGDMRETAARLPKHAFRLIYLDPPFLTGKERVGTRSEWRYPDAWPGRLSSYLPWLRDRLEAVLPLLVPSGSLVLHLDYHTVHYAKVMLDGLMGEAAFVNEIVWHYTGGGRSRSRFSGKHDTLLWYAAGSKPYFDVDAVRVPYKADSGFLLRGMTSKSGKRYRAHPLGTPIDDVWNLPIINPNSPERVGYPTQKPLALLERIIGALSGRGELIGDFCCGSGTTLVAAERLGRNWAGGDVSRDAVACTARRLEEAGCTGVRILAPDRDTMEAEPTGRA